MYNELFAALICRTVAEAIKLHAKCDLGKCDWHRPRGATGLPPR